MDRRMQFVLEWRSGSVSRAALCRAFGISRETGYKWVRRFKQVRQLSKLSELSRRPHSQPRKTPSSVEELVVAAKRQRPHWGPRKLRDWLLQRRPRLRLPAASTMGEILKRHGLVKPRVPRRRATPSTQPFAAATEPNAVWCIDFKGQFRTGDGQLCYPLTLTDAYSRMILCCQALPSTETEPVRRLLAAAFKKYGLPKAIRSDNGGPFASTGAAGLSRLSAWWLKLGISLERIEPGKPQQNGRHERMHRTLKLETATPPAATLAAQQKIFDAFVRQFNRERPHEALGGATPASRYRRSPRLLPSLVPSFSYPFCQRRVVDDSGYIAWGPRGGRCFISTALVGEVVGVLEIDERYCEIVFGPLTLGLFDISQRNRGLIRYRVGQTKVSAMSPV